jgi:hypothetical protein
LRLYFPNTKGGTKPARFGYNRFEVIMMETLKHFLLWLLGEKTWTEVVIFWVIAIPVICILAKMNMFPSDKQQDHPRNNQFLK